MVDIDVKDFTLGTAKTIKSVIAGGKYLPAHVLYNEAGVPLETAGLPATGFLKRAAASFTRPANTTAYAIGGLIANSTTAGSVAPVTLAVARVADATACIRALRIKTSDTNWKNGTIRAHLFGTSPTTSVGDGGAFNATETYTVTESGYLGYTDVGMTQQFSDPAVIGYGARPIGGEWNVVPASGTQNIFALLEARSVQAASISAATFEVLAEAWQN